MNNERQHGLYHPSFEHDACGIGFVADMKNRPAHQRVEDALKMLIRLDHRAGKNEETGDGSGIMLQIPDRLFRYAEEIPLPEPGAYGVGMVFLPKEKHAEAETIRIIEKTAEASGQHIIAWRDVPVNDEVLPPAAFETQPVIRQVFIGQNQALDQQEFEKKLYIIRRKAEKLILEKGLRSYFASLSTRTIVYKGLLTPEQLKGYYLDLTHPKTESSFGLIHSRFSTNTFPSWERAHPNRYIVHNGEINTLRGNVNWMAAREKQLEYRHFNTKPENLMPVIDPTGSDSNAFDQVLEFLTLAGRPLAQSALMMVPEPWDQPGTFDPLVKSFYEYHSTFMEPWDGPMAVAFSDGRQIGALLDRNGLRPGRYYITRDDVMIYSSEFGVLDVPASEIKEKRRLAPGELLLIDLEQGERVTGEAYKQHLANEQPYKAWLNQFVIKLEEKEGAGQEDELSSLPLTRLQKLYGYTFEEVQKLLKPMVTEGKDPIGSMGDDAPLAVFSEKPQLLYQYFKQMFAQVTNPAIDAIRESCVTSTLTWLGPEGKMLEPESVHCRRIKLDTPVLGKNEFYQLKKQKTYKTAVIRAVYDKDTALESALENMFSETEQAVENGAALIIIDDEIEVRGERPVPMLLATGCLHHFLISRGKRMDVSLIARTFEARDVHQLAMLVGYGSDAVYPILGIQTIKSLVARGDIIQFQENEAVKRYLTSLTNGLVKVMSKLGISTVQSYRGAQAFEACGLSRAFLNEYMPGTISQIDGIGLDGIERETDERLEAAWNETDDQVTLEAGSTLQWRADGEYHRFNPRTIHWLQQAARKNDYKLYKQYAEAADGEYLANVRSLFEIKKSVNKIPIEEVESVDSICRRFKTGAMSYGALSEEAHEALAIAMNRIGGKSNSGEGGEHPARFTPDDNGDLRRSAIKQVASGRFGVNSHYLSNADEIQIKIAQGAKPGEGGQLPAHKVYPWIAEVRGSTPGVGLISPPPHHDIYSIEDLAQLIYDLKRANPGARINVKLVARAGVGTIAAGVAKGLADVILISGHDGGTGASPRTSIKHAGMPWEIGLAETHQTLVLNELRHKVVLETDGKMMTGRDVIIACALGAEEYGFSTAPLVVLGCVLMRACHMDTCPVGIATQNPELRKKMIGTPDHVVNFMRFIARDVREWLSELGYRSLDELVGRTQILEQKTPSEKHWKAGSIDLSRLLFQYKDKPLRLQEGQKHDFASTFDITNHLVVHGQYNPSITEFPVMKIRNTDRAAGTLLGHHITKTYGFNGCLHDPLQLKLEGSAGQSFGAFLPTGITLNLVGDANDYVGKGLSGGELIIKPPETLENKDQVIIGNVALYGATRGKAFIRGQAGERFAVRNSGADAVVEGIGDHGCEYMTGGRVIVLGNIGKNFGAGMSGGSVYLLRDAVADQLKQKVGGMHLYIEPLARAKDISRVRELLELHASLTGSTKARDVLKRWDDAHPPFIKVIPKEYKLMKKTIKELQVREQYEKKAAIAEAFKKKQEALAKQTALKAVRLKHHDLSNHHTWKEDEGWGTQKASWK